MLGAAGIGRLRDRGGFGLVRLVGLVTDPRPRRLVHHGGGLFHRVGVSNRGLLDALSRSMGSIDRTSLAIVSVPQKRS